MFPLLVISDGDNYDVNNSNLNILVFLSTKIEEVDFKTFVEEISYHLINVKLLINFVIEIVPNFNYLCTYQI